MSAASIAGRKAGRGLIAPSLNPFPDGSIEAAQWNDAWRRASAELVADRDAQRRIKQGCFAAEACTELGT